MADVIWPTLNGRVFGEPVFVERATMSVVWHVLDRDADIEVSHHHRPHWEQKSALTFVTARLIDSMPRDVLERWQREQAEWLAANGLESASIEDVLTRTDLPEKLRRQFQLFRNQRWQDSLDDCHGECILKDQNCAEIVAQAFRYFHGQRYDLERFVIMPNHVHLLIQMRDPWSLRDQIAGLLRFTARKLNECRNRSGSVWQSEPFDHIVRSEKQFRHLQQYIEDNPKKANLPKGQSLLWISP